MCVKVCIIRTRLHEGGLKTYHMNLMHVVQLLIITTKTFVTTENCSCIKLNENIFPELFQALTNSSTLTKINGYTERVLPLRLIETPSSPFSTVWDISILKKAKSLKLFQIMSFLLRLLTFNYVQITENWKSDITRKSKIEILNYILTMKT